MALAPLRAREARVQRLRARGSADHFGAQGRIRGEVFVFVRRPDLRIDTRAFGNTVSTLVANERSFALTDFRNGQFFMGEARPCVAAQLLGVPLEVGEVVSLLAGGPPLLEGNARIRWNDGHYLVEIDGRNGQGETLSLAITTEERENARPEAQHPRPVRAELRDPRGLRAVLTFEDYETVSGVDFPKRVRVVMERDNVDLEMRYREVTLDPDLPDDAFDQSPPSEALQMQRVTCDESSRPPNPNAGQIIR
jgi:hypothetical protein